jgi:hypothetical protein
MGEVTQAELSLRHRRGADWTLSKHSILLVLTHWPAPVVRLRGTLEVRTSTAGLVLPAQGESAEGVAVSESTLYTAPQLLRGFRPCQ